MGTIADKLAYVKTTKESIKAAIVNKGVTVPDDATFRSYADLIAQIEGSAAPNLEAVTVVPTGNAFIRTPSPGYNGISSVTVEGDANLSPENIAKGIIIYGVKGTKASNPSLQTAVITPTGEDITRYPDTTQGYEGFNRVIVEGDPNLVPENIARGVTIYGVEGAHAAAGENVVLSSITVTPTGEDFTENAAEGCGFDSVTVEGDVNLAPQNIVSGITIYGVTGTAGETSADVPSEYQSKWSEAQSIYNSNTGETAPSDFAILESNGDVTFVFFLSNFQVTEYNANTTDFKAIGFRRVSYHKVGNEWIYSDFSSEASAGANYIKNIRYCTRDRLYYGEIQIYPANFSTTYVVGKPIEFTISGWDVNGNSEKLIKATGYKIGANGLQLGLPAKSSTTNTQAVIGAALTITRANTFTPTGTNTVYTNIYVSAVNIPTRDITIAIFGLEAA